MGSQASGPRNVATVAWDIAEQLGDVLRYIERSFYDKDMPLNDKYLKEQRITLRKHQDHQKSAIDRQRTRKDA